MELPLFITGNRHKAEYLARLLAMPIEHLSIELEELQSVSLEKIVEHKARQAYQAVGQPVLVEDVALGFVAFGGLPGPFIKFFTELDDGLEKLCRMLDGFDDRRAVAACVYGYYDGEEMRLFRGELTGYIAQSPCGDGGFGWDQIFCPDGYGGRTRAELSPEENAATYVRLKPIDEVGAFLASIREGGDALNNIRNGQPTEN